MTTLEHSPLQGSLPMELPLTQSAAGSRARILAWRDLEPESRREPVAGFGPKSAVLLANYDRASSSWKTSQHSLQGGLDAFSETWPRSGTMRNGTAYQLLPLVRLTDATVSGLWPTPCKTEPDETPERWMERQSAKAAAGIRLHFKLSVAVRMWPTPTKHNAKETNAPSESLRNTPTLAAQAGGSLNPTWVEWLMGFPIGHTDLQPSVTPSSRKSRNS